MRRARYSSCTESRRPLSRRLLRCFVGIDGSNGSLTALRWALNQGAVTDAPVEVAHCYLPLTLTDLGFSTPHELHIASAIMVVIPDQAVLRHAAAGAVSASG